MVVSKNVRDKLEHTPTINQLLKGPVSGNHSLKYTKRFGRAIKLSERFMTNMSVYTHTSKVCPNGLNDYPLGLGI